MIILSENEYFWYHLNACITCDFKHIHFLCVLWSSGLCLDEAECVLETIVGYICDISRDSYAVTGCVRWNQDEVGHRARATLGEHVETETTRA